MEVTQLDKQWRDNIKAKGMSYAVAARNAEDGISVAQTVESSLDGNSIISSKIKRGCYSS